MNNTCKIYVIKNTVNDKIYVGQTWQTLLQRFYSHKSVSSECIHLSRAMKKYGKDNFSIELLVICDNQMTADYLENFWIKTFDSIQNGYNLKEGGSRGRLTEEHKQKISKSLKGKTLGRKQSEEHRKNNSLAHKGNNNCIGRKYSDDTLKKMSETKKGKKASEETKNKMSISHEGFSHTEESKKKISDAHKGKKNPHSEEWKQKHSEAMKKYYQIKADKLAASNIITN